MSEVVLLTGGCGFIGTNFVRHLREHRPDRRIINLDLLTYAGNLENLADIENDSHYEFVRGDVCDVTLVNTLVERCDAVVHMAAESHVDRSIKGPGAFVRTNIEGTHCLLEAARGVGGRRFVLVSTDEVYGSLPLEEPTAKFSETSPLRPNSPYAASKASADLLALSYHHTFGLDVVLTRSSNNLGPYQFPEKVIPLFTTNLLRRKRVPLYGDGRNVRDWIHVDDHCAAVLAALERGRPGEIYNIGADNERSNLELTHAILKIMNADSSMIQHVEDRLGHDRRYAIDATKARRDLDWQPKRSQWPEALQHTVDWYMTHRNWWERIRNGEYRRYYEEQYERRCDALDGGA